MNSGPDDGGPDGFGPLMPFHAFESWILGYSLAEQNPDVAAKEWRRFQQIKDQILIDFTALGLRIQPNTESLGRGTTTSVVTSITGVILLDAAERRDWKHYRPAVEDELRAATEATIVS
mgnify:CR=1 FL=1